jgi:hypothetical protein
MTEVAPSDQLLVVIDPVARKTDGESARIAKDVLCAGASTKVCLPEDAEEFARALAKRGSRRLVVVGDDRALVRAVALLHRRRELAGCSLAVVPVGSGPAVALARSLGVPGGPVVASRAVLDGRPRRLDLLVDDSDGVVVGTLRIPSVRGGPAPSAGGFGEGPGDIGREHSGWLRTCRSLVRTLGEARPAGLQAALHGALQGALPVPSSRLRVEADGVTLVDLDQPVRTVSLTAGSAGTAEIEVCPLSVGAQAAPVRARARRVTVSGADFRYRADEVVGGPVRTRTWTVREGAWTLTLPK